MTTSTLAQAKPDDTFPSGLRRRLREGLGASFSGPLATMAIQLCTVPVLLHAWGASKYGDWLLLSAIPTYLNLSDLGFGDASGSDMTCRVARRDYKGALITFQSSWALLSLVSLAAMAAAIPIAWLMPWQQLLNVSSESMVGARQALLMLAAYALLGQQCLVLESGFRCDGNFASGSWWLTVQRVAEMSTATAAAALGGSFAQVAFALLAAKIIGVVLYAQLLLRKSPWLKLGFRHIKLSALKHLAKPALGFTIIPIAQSLSLQGFTLLIGSIEGAIQVTAFTTTRTLARVSLLIVSSISKTLWPELSFAFGSGNLALARRLHKYALRITITTAIIVGLTLWLTGPTIYRVWLRGNVPLNTPCFHILLLVSLAGSLWNTSSVVPMSTNLHQGVAWALLISSALSLMIATLSIPHFGLVGASTSLLIADLAMCWVAFRTASKQLGGGNINLFATNPETRWQ